MHWPHTDTIFLPSTSWCRANNPCGDWASEVIDLYMLHRPDFLCEPSEVAAAFSKLKESERPGSSA
jgi:hypothetical protein